MKAIGGNSKDKLLSQLSELQEENNKLKSLCMEYQTILKDGNQKVWTWDVVNDVYSINVSTK